MSDIAALILAAGRGTRFGEEPKLLAPWRGKPLARHVAEAALQAGSSDVIVVTGHRADEVRAALDGLALRFAHNPAYAEGLSTSLKAGFRALPSEARAVLVLLGDMPLVSAPLMRHLALAWERRGQPPALVPVHDGRRGNPVILSRALAPAIEALSGDVGAGPLLRALPGIVEEPVEDAAVLADVDTQEALDGLA